MAKGLIRMFLLVVAFLVPIAAQDSIAERAENILRAQKVLSDGKTAVFGNQIGIKIDSLYLKISGESYSNSVVEFEGRDPVKTSERKAIGNEYWIDFPNYIRIENRIDTNNPQSDMEMKILAKMIANMNEVEINTDAFVNGQKMDLGKGIGAMAGVSQQILGDDAEKVFGKDGKNLKNMLDGTSKMPRSAVEIAIREELFPIFLSYFTGHEQDFIYIGKAEHSGKSAHVLELLLPQEKVIASSKTTIRYFFDTETNRLLMITRDVSIEDRGIQTSTKTYFSDHKKINGFSIPTSIKIEAETIVDQKMEIMGMKMNGTKQTEIKNLKIDKFEINKELSPELFEIKK